jgi:aminopeptidase 2
MLVNYLGEKDFQTGIRNYLQKFKYSNARTRDLWEALSAAAGGKPVADLMNSWTRQMGYPVVSVKDEAKGGKFQLEIKQERFLSSGDVSAQDDTATWFVPLQIITSKSPKSPLTEVLDGKKKSVTLDESEYFKLNFQHTGFYRVNYSKESLKRIGQLIKDGKLNPSDRIGVITDAFSLSQAGYSPVVDGLDLLTNYGNEDNYM